MTGGMGFVWMVTHGWYDQIKEKTDSLMKCPLCQAEPRKPVSAGVLLNDEQAYYFHLQNEHKRTMEEIESLRRQVEAGTIGRKSG